MTDLDRRLPTHARVAEAYARMTEMGLWELIGDVAEIRDALQEQGEHDPAIEAVWAAIELGDPWLVVAASEAADIDWNPAEHPRDHKGRFAKKPGGKLVSATITKAGAMSAGGGPVEVNKHGVNIAAIKPGDTIVDKKGNLHTVEKTQGTKYFKTVDGSPAWVGGQTIQKHYPATDPEQQRRGGFSSPHEPKKAKAKAKLTSPKAPAAPTAPVKHDYAPGDFVDLPNGQLGKVFKVQGDQAQVQYLNGDLKWHDTNQLVPYELPSAEKAAFKASQAAPKAAPTPDTVNKHGVDLAQIKVGDTILDSKGNPHKVASVQGKKNLVFKTEDGSPAWVSANGVKGHTASTPPPGMVEVPGLPGVHVPDSTTEEEQKLLDAIMGEPKIPTGGGKPNPEIEEVPDGSLTMTNPDTGKSGEIIPVAGDKWGVYPGESAKPIATYSNKDAAISKLAQHLDVSLGEESKQTTPVTSSPAPVLNSSGVNISAIQPGDKVVLKGDHELVEVASVSDNGKFMEVIDPIDGDIYGIHPDGVSQHFPAGGSPGSSSTSTAAPTGGGVGSTFDPAQIKSGDTIGVEIFPGSTTSLTVLDIDGDYVQGEDKAGETYDVPIWMVKTHTSAGASVGTSPSPSPSPSPSKAVPLDISKIKPGDQVEVSLSFNKPEAAIKQTADGDVKMTNPTTGESGLLSPNLYGEWEVVKTGSMDVLGTYSSEKLAQQHLADVLDVALPGAIKPTSTANAVLNDTKKFKVLEIDQDGNYVIDIEGHPFPVKPVDITKHYLPNGDVGDVKLIGAKAGGGAAFVPVDVTRYKKIAGPKGSNDGGLYEAPDGSKHYVKFQQSEKHARNEVLANEFYRVAGVRVPDVRLAQLPDGKIGTVSRWEEGIQTGRHVHDDDFRSEAAKGFGMDALLGNWDVAGASHDNLGKVEGQPIRIDSGGALLFRAQGSQKGSAFGDKASEYDTLTDPATNPEAAQLYGNLTKEQKAASVRRVQMLTQGQIDRLVDSAGFDSATATHLKQTLKARRRDLILRAREDSVHVTPAGHVQIVDLPYIGVKEVQDETGKRLGSIKKHPNGKYTYKKTGVPLNGLEYDSFDDALRALAGTEKPPPVYVPPKAGSVTFKPVDPDAISGQAALNVVGAIAGKVNMTTGEKSALKSYTGAGYGPINKYLRFDAKHDMPTDPDLEKKIQSLDSLFAKAPPVPKTILVDRGVSDVNAIFGPIGSQLGKTFYDNGYSSTGAGFSFGHGATLDLKIEIPAGSRGVLRPSSAGSYGDTEREILINRGGQFEIIKDELVNGKRTIRLRLLSTATDIQGGVV